MTNQTINQLKVRADPQSLLRNILNYFSDNHAYIQELFQNARRAEASEVTVEINTQAGTVAVSDNGHGVLDPQDLLNIGKSEWCESTVAEQPAGMGLFSVFKLGRVAEIRSGRWKLRLDYGLICKGKPAVLEQDLNQHKGTRIVVSKLHDNLGAPDGVHPDAYARRWANEAAFMPFRTAVVLDGSQQFVKAFNPLVIPEGAMRADTSWGWVDLHTRKPECGNVYENTTLIQQGIEMPITHHLHLTGQYARLWVRIYARSGTVNFTLPDRDHIQDNEKYRNLLADVRSASVEAVVSRIGTVKPSRQRTLTSFVYGWDKCRAVELPYDLQSVLVADRRYTMHRTSRQEIEKRLAEGEVPCSFLPTYDTAFELIPLNLMRIPATELELFKAMFPDHPVVKNIRFDITADNRSDILWHAGDITLTLDNGEKRIVQPVEDQAVLTCADLQAEFVPDDRKRADFRNGYDFAVVHSGQGVVTCPNLDPWYQYHEEDMDGDQADEAWRMSDYAMHIASTWRGVPADDLTLDELRMLLRDRFGGTPIQFKDANLELIWGNRVSVESVTVEFSEHGETVREVRLQREGGFLKEVQP